MVYQVVKALPMEEQKTLFDMLQKEFNKTKVKQTATRSTVLTKEEATRYLLRNLFNK